MSLTHSSLRAPLVTVRGARVRSEVRQQTNYADIFCRVVILAGIAAILISRMDHAVVPHDDGTIGQAAERILQGELPHRDFDDPYTGLLSFVNAAAFRVLGVSILSARLVLLTATLVSFLAMYGLCRRIMPTWVAMLTTAAAFFASIPNYFSPMPTWYNLYCTVFAIAAMLRYHDTQRLRWVAIAGVCTGVSFLFKLVGIYFAATAALFVIFAEQQRAESHPTLKISVSGYWHLLTIAGLCGYVAMIVAMVSSLPKLVELTLFVGPSAVIAGFLSWNEWRLRHHEARARFQRLLKIGAMFFAGFAAPVGLYLLPYALGGALSSLFVGVFVLPLRRLSDNLIGHPLELRPFFAGVALLTCLGLALGLALKIKRTAPWVAAAVACVVIILGAACTYPFGYSAVWSVARLTPLAATVGLVVCLWCELRHPDAWRKTKSVSGWSHAEETVLIVAAAGVFSLVQFPLTHGIYFLYVAPLVVLAGTFTLAFLFPATAVRTATGRKGKGHPAIARSADVRKLQRCGVPMAVVIFAGSVAAFSTVWILPGLPVAFGRFYYPASHTARIPGARCPIRCDGNTAQLYTRLIQQVTRHSRKGSAILALPDAPEVYFLSGRRNPTRTFFDAFDTDYGTPERDQRLLDTLERQQIDVVVLRNLVEFSYLGASPEFQREMARRYPHMKQITIGRRLPAFTVFWRNRKPERQRIAQAEVAQR